MMIEQIPVKSDGYFGILEAPQVHKQHPNETAGLDLYVPFQVLEV